MFKYFYYNFVISCIVIGFTIAVPKFEDSKSAFSDNQWRRSYKVNDSYAQPSQQNDRTERLGYTTGYGSGLSGYPQSGSGVGVYSPLKIDLGGIVVGAIIGIGALLIVPKILSAFSGGGYGGNYRSADGTDATGLSEMLTKLDDILSKNNIDSTTCVQRAVCNYVRSSEYNLQIGNADQSDQIIHTLSGDYCIQVILRYKRNALVEYMLDGTAVKEAIRNGKSVNGRDCDSIYAGCPLDKESAMQLLTKLLPNNGQ